METLFPAPREGTAAIARPQPGCRWEAPLLGVGGQWVRGWVGAVSIRVLGPGGTQNLQQVFVAVGSSREVAGQYLDYHNEQEAALAPGTLRLGAEKT